MDSVTLLTPKRPDVIDEAFGEEVVVVNLRTGRYYSLEGSGGAVWAALAPGGVTPAAVAAAAGTDVEAVLGFLGRLVAEELVVVDGEPLPAPSGDVRLESDDEPRLLVFTDMEDILLLDPIHDIDLDGTGWPAPPSQTAA